MQKGVSSGVSNRYPRRQSSEESQNVQLKKIDKALYQERRSRIQWAMIAALFALALLFSELYRYLFVGGESSVWLNGLGVATAVAIVVFVLLRLRDTPYFEEVNYVWKLKQELNRIYRAQQKLDAALAQNRREALIIRLYNLEASRQVYDLDDNTLTMSELVRDLDELRERIREENLEIAVSDYRADMLDRL